MYVLKNDTLTVSISPIGAEIMSVKRGDCEYMWQGDPEFWSSRAPLLFPVCGRSFGGVYTHEGKTYELTNHGFARRQEFAPKLVTDTELVLVLNANDDTRKVYPFEFELEVRYVLTGERLYSEVKVTNNGTTVLPATFGLHPGFNVPFDNGSFEDWYLEFAEECTPNELMFSDTCFNTGKKRPYPLKDSRILPLRHELFNIDAIFMDRTSSSVTLKSDASQRSVTVNFSGFPYVGIWHKPQSKAPYVCIEPWCGLPSFDGAIDDIMTKNDMLHLLPSHSHTYSYDIIFG
jgi:galactose mutarotase-like enzyme